MTQKRYFTFGSTKTGVSLRQAVEDGTLAEYASDDWREVLDIGIDELKNHLPELAKELAGMYDVSPHNWSREGGDGHTYFIEEVSEDQFRRIEGLDPTSTSTETDTYAEHGHDHPWEVD